MDAKLVRHVWRRARFACEYCHMPQRFDDPPFEMDHVIPSVHGGKTVAANLALSCFCCNAYKGSNVAGHDPATDRLKPLFIPRVQKWTRHFEWNGAMLVGKTGIGRATIDVLKINLPERVSHRRLLTESGVQLRDT